MKKVEEVFRTMDEAGIPLKLRKRRFAQTETKWLGLNVSEKGIKQET